MCQMHHLLYGDYMFRPFIGSSSGLPWNQVNEYCVHVGTIKIYVSAAF